MDSEAVEWIMVEAIIDIVFLVDIVFSFFSAYYNKIEAVVSNHR